MTLRSVAVVLALASVGTAAAATPLKSGFFQLSRVSTRTQGSTLSFTVAVSHVPAGDKPTLAWSITPTGGAACENNAYPGATLSRDGLVVWDEQGPTFQWIRGKKASCAGTVSVVAENQYEHCTAKVTVQQTTAKNAVPACALGGYAIGFSTLPVPAGVFKAYGSVSAELARPARSAAAAATEIRNALRTQTASLALFPPVWFCNFQTTFTPIAALRADLIAGSTAAATRDARAAQQALAKCAPASVRSAFGRLATSPNPNVLDATLAHDFPTIFGFRYGDLVDRVAAEEVALTAAEAATGDPAAVTQQVTAARSSALGISTGLDHYQKAVERVENANG